MKSESSKTIITVAICTYNRADYLKDTLNDLAVQTADKNSFEVLVINNNSTDHTEAVCTDFQKTHPKINFRFVDETNQGLSFARNRSVKEATAATLLFIDDDVHLKENFVSTALNYLKSSPHVSCAGGRIFVSFDDADPDWIPNELMPMFGLHDLGESDKLYPTNNFPRGGNMLIKKSVFEKHGLFDTNLGRIGKNLLGSEEKAFFESVRNQGIELHYWADLKLWHRIGSNRLKNEYLKKQSVGIGKSERFRVMHSKVKTSGKLFSELIKLTGSVVLGMGYLMRGKVKAATFLLKFRVWVLQGFINPKND
ncbi:MAG: glycosyltransferase [Balneolaceae bacterium]